MKLKLDTALPFSTFVKSMLKGKRTPEPPMETVRTRGEGLARLHEYQHQVVVGLFKINIGGLIAFLLVVLSFTLFTISDPNAPKWIGIVMISVAVLLLVGCYRTVREFNFYRKHYAELMAQLQDKLRQYLRHTKSSEQRKGAMGPESRVLSVLKPKEHKGWDGKSCENCHKNLELLAAVCQHCGHEQEVLLQN